MRVENAEKEKLENRREYAKKSFALFPAYLRGEELSQYWGNVEFMYVPYYAYEELLAPFGDKPGQTASLLASAERLTAYLTNREVQQLNPPPESIRQEILAKYAGKLPATSIAEDRSKSAERAFAMFSPEHQLVAPQILLRLVRLSLPEEVGEDTRLRVKLSDLGEAAKPALDELTHAGLLVKGRDNATGEETIELANDSLIQNWERMRAWLEEDREFLLWRQQLQAVIVDWEKNRRDQGALLSGAPLEVAKRWHNDRREDLNESENSYIVESSRVDLRRRRKRAGVVAAAAAVFLLLLGSYIYWQAQQRTKEAEASSYYGTGNAHRNQGKVDLAIAAYNQAIQLKPDYTEAYLNRGRSYSDKGDYDLAIADCDQAIKLDPNYAWAYNNRGNAYYGKGNYDRAVIDCNQAIKLDSNYAMPYYNRGNIYFNRGEYDRAIADYDQAIKRDRNYADAYNQRGRAYHQKGTMTVLRKTTIK